MTSDSNLNTSNKDSNKSWTSKKNYLIATGVGLLSGPFFVLSPLAMFLIDKNKASAKLSNSAKWGLWATVGVVTTPIMFALLGLLVDVDETKTASRSTSSSSTSSSQQSSKPSPKPVKKAPAPPSKISIGEINQLLVQYPYPDCKANRDSCKAKIKTWKETVPVAADQMIAKGVKPMNIKVTNWDEVGNNYFIDATVTDDTGSRKLLIKIKTEVETGMLDDESYALLGGAPGVYTPGTAQPIAGYKNMFNFNSEFKNYYDDHHFSVAFLGGKVRIKK